MPNNVFLNYVLAGFPLLWVDTFEELRVMTSFAQEITQSKNKYSMFSWDSVDGIRSLTVKNNTLGSIKLAPEDDMDTTDPMIALSWFENQPEYSVLFLKDFHRYINSTEIPLYRKIRNSVPIFKAKPLLLVILAPAIKIPLELEKDTTVISFSLPDKNELRKVLKAVCVSASQGDKISEYPKDDNALLESALGMTTFEAENAFSISLIETKSFDPAIIRREKAAIVKKTGHMEVMEVNKTGKDIGCLENFKAWLQARVDCFSDAARAFGITPPKGVLLVGVPGTGKSLAAKCSASMMGRPLLRLDMGKIYGSLVGESEANMHRCLKIAEAVAPCVLFIDELEKSFSGKGEDSHEVTKRVFASFLTWLQEKTADVFIIATANNVQILPPELLRPGRFDCIFWVDVPDTIEQITEILKIHIRQRGHEKDELDYDSLASLCAGFTGAEIEAWVAEALVHAFQAKRALSQEDFVVTVKDITSITTLMKADIKTAREWAKTHGVKYASIKKMESEKTPGQRKIAL